MGNVYEQYEKNRENMKTGGEYKSGALYDRIDAAMDQTELLKDVRRRVTAFVEAYETLNSGALEEVELLRSRENPTDRVKAIADNIERDYQEVYTQGHHGKEDFTAITLDDLKILLDQFPQGL